jgi:hypothetical protein
MKKAFCLRVSTTAARCAAACFSRHLRDLGAGLRKKTASQKPFDGDPYTRARGGRIGQVLYGTGMCSFQGEHAIRISALTALTLRLSEKMVASYQAVLKVSHDRGAPQWCFAMSFTVPTRSGYFFATGSRQYRGHVPADGQSREKKQDAADFRPKARASRTGNSEAA